MGRIRVAPLESLPEGGGCLVSLAGLRLALFRVGQEVFALGDRCSHAEASLADGLLFEGMVECPRHGAAFDLRTGEARSLPATRPVPVYRTEVEGGEVFVHAPEAP